MTNDTMTDVNDFLMGGGKPAAFKQIGDQVIGNVLHAESRQQTDLNTGEPKFWKDGSPMKMVVVSLQTEERESEDDDGIRTVYVRGQMTAAVRSALQQAHVKGLEIGGKLQVRYKADGVAKQRGFNPPKEYEAKYRAPAAEPVMVPADPPVIDPDSEIPF